MDLLLQHGLQHSLCELASPVDLTHSSFFDKTASFALPLAGPFSLYLLAYYKFQSKTIEQH
eukprot:1158693-Pelagomonas_calceolata.AAC.4